MLDRSSNTAAESQKAPIKMRIDGYHQQIGIRLRSARLRRGFSQEKLADAIGLTFQQIQKYENGTNRISSGVLVCFADILGVPISTFVEGLGPSADSAPEDTKIVEKLVATRGGYELAQAMLDIRSQEDRNAALRVLRALAARTTEAAQ